MMKQIVLSGIKPTGTLHIGNYLGMIKPAFDLVENYQTLYFVADDHALTTLKDKDALNQHVYDVAATLSFSVPCHLFPTPESRNLCLRTKTYSLCQEVMIKGKRS